MQKSHLKYLICPVCRQSLRLTRVEREDRGRIQEGELGCEACQQSFPITGAIPRFVPLDNYARGFGLEWIKHARTQYDADSGIAISRTRFFAETRWPEKMPGELILEVGSGSGRFTEHAASTGALVVSLDMSHAVEANYASNGHLPNVLIVQGSLYDMPFPRGVFDRVFCFGVLQHTPDVKKAFFSLLPFLRPGGSLAVDVYRRQRGWRRLLQTKYLVRPITRRMAPEMLYRLCNRYVRLMWPVAKLLRKIPRIGGALNWALLIADYAHEFDFPDATLREWAILDTFDMLSPAYDSPQYLETLQQWFAEAGLQEVEVHYGYNGIEGRGLKPAEVAATVEEQS